MKKRFFKAITFTVLSFCLLNCSNEIEELNSTSSSSYSTATKEEIITDFAKVLSAVIAENQDARELIKTEALKKFDRNNDILWEEIKNKNIGSCTLRDAIIQKSSKEFIMQAEEKMPLLNIYFPEISIFGVSPEKYSSNDNELPVVANTPEKDLIYFGGKVSGEIRKGDIPAFNVLVINENKLVEIDETSTRGSIRKYKLKYEDFGKPQNDKVTRNGSEICPSVSFGISERLKQAYNTFNKENDIKYQRYYAYYGITPQKTTGTLNSDYAEYIHFIEVSPKAYDIIADQANVTGRTDPMFSNGKTEIEVSKQKSDFTFNELVNKIWTSGSYVFRFEIYKSTEKEAIVKTVAVKPSEIWDFHEMEHRTYKSSGLFSHSKYTYKIDLNDFTTKKYYLPTPICLGTWDIAEESIYRKVKIWEEDDSAEEEFSKDLKYKEVSFI